MKALKIFLSIAGGLLALWLLLGLFAKKDYRIERSAEINASREIVYEQVHFFKNFKNWSPWHVYDPNMQTSIEGTDGAPGARYNWSGNDKVGKGYQLMKSVTPGRVDIDVDFGWGPSPAFFSLEDLAGEKTKITWGMNMHVAFPWNAGGLFTDINAFVGKDFENGLANLKKVCEQIAHPSYRGYEVAETNLPPVPYAGVRQVVAFADIPAFFADNFSKVMEEAAKAGAQTAGHPSGLFWTYDTIAMKTDMAAAIPLDKQVKTGNGVQIFTVGGPRALVIDYFGPYDKTGEAHFAMDDYMAEKKLRSIPPVMEEYMTDPGAEPDTSKWLTKIIYFVEPRPDSSAINR